MSLGGFGGCVASGVDVRVNRAVRSRAVSFTSLTTPKFLVGKISWCRFSLFGVFLLPDTFRSCGKACGVIEESNQRICTSRLTTLDFIIG